MRFARDARNAMDETDPLAAGANAGDEMPAVVAEHSRAFEEFMAKFDKAASYCPDSAPPCEESTRRERVFLENVVAIEKHNAERAREGGMKLGVTRFADLTPDEFANHHGHAHAGALARVGCCRGRRGRGGQGLRRRYW